MKSPIIFTILSFICLAQLSFNTFSPETEEIKIDSLRAAYQQPIMKWPKPTIDSGVVWEEFKALPKIDSSYFDKMEQPDVLLGRLLFFDPILSGSNQISCSSCHNPQTSWADKSAVPVGNDHLSGTRNSISLLNVSARKSFFWDGRAKSLEEQAVGPIEAHNEMAMKIDELPKKLEKYQEYKKLFKNAYGTDKITVKQIMASLAEFQNTITSRQSRFDRFLNGEHKLMTDKEIHGMHLFRTKARCMNCHNGQYLTDDSFHNIGLTYYKRKFEDLGRYHVTKNPDDVGKFRTPSLRDVMNTSPWMHNGMFDNIIGLINIYNSGMQMNTATPAQKAADPMYPITDPLMKKLNLTAVEKDAIVSFLESVTATQYKMRRPEKLPR